MKREEPIWRRYLRLFGPDAYADADDEIAFHLGELEAELRRKGLSEGDARQEAQRRFGDAAQYRRALGRQDAKRHARVMRLEWWGGVMQDVRLAVRKAGREPAFTAAVVLVLALGIGATTAMFSAVDAAMLRPLPFFEPHRLVTMNHVNIPFRWPGSRGPQGGPRALAWDDLTAMPEFSRVAAYAAGGLNLSDPVNPVRVSAGVVTAGFFETLGVSPMLGRVFDSTEGRPDGPAVAVLSYAMWRSRFGQADVLGRTLSLNENPFTIIGVMPQGFSFPQQSDLWIPLTVPITPATFESFRGWLPSRVIARLAPTVSQASAAARVEGAWHQVLSRSGTPEETANAAARLNDVQHDGALTSWQRQMVGDRGTALWVLLGATGLLLLIACANVTNLLLSRAAGRRREIAVRGVLGATRGRVVRQLLTESLILAVSGAVLGLAIAPAALSLARAMLPAELSGVAPAELDLRVLGFAAATAVFTGVAFGLWPALGGSRRDAGAVIKGGGGWGATAGGAGRARRALVGAEIALTVMLLVGAGLMLKSFERLLGTDAGFRTDRAGTLQLSFAGRTPAAAKVRVLDAVLERLARTPGVSAAGVVNDLPLRGPGGISIAINADGRSTDAKGEPLFARYLMASGGYFSALGIGLVRGRVFTVNDDSTAPKVGIVNETMARTLWPGQDALGRQFSWGGRPGQQPVLYTVVGVARDVRESGLDRDPWSQMYFSIQATPPDNVAIVARGALSGATLLTGLREAVRAADPSQAVYDVRMMDDVRDASVAPRRTNTMLIAAFGALALLLAALGVFGVVSYSVAQRTRELGIRSALGATGGDLVSLVAGEMLWVVVIGSVVGVSGAWAASRVLQSLVYDVSVRDTATFVLAPIVMLVPVAVATLIPARRSLKLNPMDVIRAE
ncbi:MAG TPA: ABC transporter permease [Gemmatimonadales bacterium]